eukprot:3071006-Rhodomonas_salina.3
MERYLRVHGMRPASPDEASPKQRKSCAYTTSPGHSSRDAHREFMECCLTVHEMRTASSWNAICEFMECDPRVRRRKAGPARTPPAPALRAPAAKSAPLPHHTPAAAKSNTPACMTDCAVPVQSARESQLIQAGAGGRSGAHTLEACAMRQRQHLPQRLLFVLPAHVCLLAHTLLADARKRQRVVPAAPPQYRTRRSSSIPPYARSVRQRRNVGSVRTVIRCVSTGLGIAAA